MTAKDALHLLEELFVAFDDICRRHGVEKIKTIGDAYMAVAGAPFACPDHAERMARVALEMQHILTQRDGSENLQMRIGIHSGAVAAGVLGKDRFVYDLWGDTVNVASRLESHGAAGRIQISQETRDLLGDRFETEARGRIELKGRGLTATWWLIAEWQDGDAHGGGGAQQV
jgi:adenylate cyclase